MDRAELWGGPGRRILLPHAKDAGGSLVTRTVPRGFGIVGTGVIAAVHADAIASLPGTALVAVTDVAPAAASAFRRAAQALKFLLNELGIPWR
jgi:hypothetical protein